MSFVNVLILARPDYFTSGEANPPCPSDARDF